MANKPKVRFKQHHEEWEEKKLGEIYDFLKGKGLSKDKLSYKGKNKCILYGEIFTKYNFEIRNDISFTNSDDGVPSVAGDIIMPGSTTTDGIDLAKAVHVPESNILYGGDIIILRPKDINTVNAYFQSTMLSSIKREQIAAVAQGITIVHLHGSDLANMSYSMPKFPEQQKIGEFFAALDELIGAKEEELEKLKQLKQALLQQMFPREDDNNTLGGGNSQIINTLNNHNLTISTKHNTPHIRFKGFTKEWEKKSIGELMDVGSVKRVHQADWTDKGIRFMRARDIVAYYNNEDIADKLYIREEQYELFSAISGKVKKNDLLVTGVGTIGIPFLVKNESPLYFKDGNIIWLKNNDALDGLFLYYSYTNDNIIRYIKDSAGVGTVGTYTITSCKETPILVPSLSEQQMIGDFFRQQDEQIAAAQQQITKLKIIKQALLQKMFAA